MKIEDGQILISEPFMGDPNFKRTVLQICDHHDDGTLGFVLNKPTGIFIHEYIPDFKGFDAEVFYGGPVYPNSLQFIHNVGDILEGSKEIGPNIWAFGDFEKLSFLIKTGVIEPHNIRFFLGCAGWSPGQLDDEITRGDWFQSSSDPNYLFNPNLRPEELWKKVLDNKGSVYTVMAQMPDDPHYN